MKLEKYLWKYLCKHGEKREPETVCTCGSCRYYDFTYQAQLEGKREWVAFTFKNVVEYEKPIVIVPSPKLNHYRSRMDFVATKGLIGLRRSGGFNNVYDVEQSCIFDETIGEFLEKLRLFKKYPDYDLITHEGILRYFVFRKTEHAGVTLWHLSVVVREILPEFAADFEAFLHESLLWDKLNSICVILQPSLSDLSYGDVSFFIKEGAIKQDIIVEQKAITFTYGPQSFFQANISVFELVLKYMRKHIEGQQFTTIYDLYGGVGSIGICLADLGQKLVNVEVSKDNTDYFLMNAEQNGVTNASVITQTVEEYLKENAFEKTSLVIFDPPRIGVEKKVMEQFLAKEILPDTIVYMSCNPATQAEDIRLLAEKYDITALEVFDMFPHASHVETVAILKKKCATIEDAPST
jgi:23S rRNA (uracil-5-)-methyltransferase RumA